MYSFKKAIKQIVLANRYTYTFFLKPVYPGTIVSKEYATTPWNVQIVIYDNQENEVYAVFTIESHETSQNIVDTYMENHRIFLDAEDDEEAQELFDGMVKRSRIS